MTRCDTCGEVLPHYCAPLIRVWRNQSGRTVRITDRVPVSPPSPVSPAQVSILVYPAISPYARLMLGSDLDADGCPPYEWRREYLAEWGAA